MGVGARAICSGVGACGRPIATKLGSLRRLVKESNCCRCCCCGARASVVEGRGGQPARERERSGSAGELKSCLRLGSSYIFQGLGLGTSGNEAISTQQDEATTLEYIAVSPAFLGSECRPAQRTITPYAPFAAAVAFALALISSTSAPSALHAPLDARCRQLALVAYAPLRFMGMLSRHSPASRSCACTAMRATSASAPA